MADTAAEAMLEVRCSNGAAVDCRASELESVTQAGINASPYFSAPFERFTREGERDVASN